VSVVSACQSGGGSESGPPPTVIAPGSISREDEAEARRLLAAAEVSFEARRFLEALRATGTVIESFPASSVSGDALLLSARAELELGAFDRADAAAERYAELVAQTDSRATSARLLQARAQQGNAAAQLDRLLRIEVLADSARADTALVLARAAADSLSPAELDAVLQSAPGRGVLAPIIEVRHAVTLLERGDTLGATQLATAAIEAGVPAPEREVAEGVLRGELPPDRRRVTTFSIAAVLPQGGPPGLAEFARLVAEGIEVAAATVLGEPYQVTVVPRDSQGDPSMAAGLVSELESEGFAGAVGFLEDETLLAAGPARQRALPIVSPTARSASLAGEGIYSLEGPDPEAAAMLARYAASRAHQRVAIILPETQTANEEAAAFEAEAQRLGVLVVGRYPYTPQATFFESQILGAQDALRAAEIAALGLAPEDTLRVEMLEPVAIFLPIPPEDVEYVAPQLAHFALDTLAIEIMGTTGWTDPQVLQILEPRYLDGVVATATVGTNGAGSPGLARFREAYEQHFQRTLVSPTPAIGYDAALLLLEALRPGRLRPEDIRLSFESLSEVEGATGIFSVANDRIVRRTELVRIDGRELVPVPLF
jgi:ABC-type branched-subunit amino acid transport system substrate-binding protein